MSVLSRLRAIAARDEALGLFGADVHYHHALAPLSEFDTASLESRLEARLPAAYRDYLTTQSSGGAGPGYGLQWTPALLAAFDAKPGDDDTRDAAHVAAIAARVFESPRDAAWLRERLPPLTDAEMDRRLEATGLPVAMRGPLKEAAAWAKTAEGRRDRYIDSLTALVRELSRDLGRARRAFPFRARHTAAPDVDAIDWASLDEDAGARARAELKSKFGFDHAEDGTLPLGDHGGGMRSLLVVNGPNAGSVWRLDTENFLLEPEAPSFDAYLDAWLGEMEASLARGDVGGGSSLWA